MNLTREELKNKKLELLNNIMTEEELNKIKEEIKKEVEDIILNFNDNDNEVMLDE